MCIVFVCGSRWTRAVSSVLVVSAIMLALPGLLPAPSVCSVTECDFHINAVFGGLAWRDLLKNGEKIRKSEKENWKRQYMKINNFLLLLFFL